MKKKLLEISILGLTVFSLIGCSASRAVPEESKMEEEVKATVGAFDFYDKAPIAEMAQTSAVAYKEEPEITETTERQEPVADIIGDRLPVETEAETVEQSTDVIEEYEEEYIEHERYEINNQVSGDVVTDEESPEIIYESQPPNNNVVNEAYAANGTKIWWTKEHSRPQLVLAENFVNGKEIPSSIAARTGAKTVINGGMWWTGSGIACGVTGIGGACYQVLDDGQNGDTLVMYGDGTLDSVYMTEDEYYRIMPEWCVKGFVPVIYNGSRTSYEHERHPRTFIAQDWNGTYYAGVSGGRDINGPGLTYNELYDFAVGQISSNLRFLYVLDGGGSSCMVSNGSVVNTPTDGSERAVVNCIVFY